MYIFTISFDNCYKGDGNNYEFLFKSCNIFLIGKLDDYFSQGYKMQGRKSILGKMH